MKIKILKDQHKSLAAHIQALCTVAGDDYELDLSKIEDVGGLKAAKDRERDAHNATKTRIAELEKTYNDTVAELTQFQDLAKNNVPKANFDALEASYKTKIDNLLKERTASEGKLKGALDKLLVDSEANRLASEISTSPVLLAPVIRARLVAEIDSEGKGLTRILDGTGKPSALTFDDLKKEILANRDYAPILKASQSSGSGAPGGAAGSGAQGQPHGQPQKAAFAGMSPKDIAANLRASGAVPAGA